jgi:putative alpha-1,2-mannosidase
VDRRQGEEDWDKKKKQKKKTIANKQKKKQIRSPAEPPPPQDLAFCHTGGYAYGNEELLAFSHLHMVGAGVTDLGNVGVMPLAGPFREACAAPRASCPGRLSKPTERASPGYYTSSVLLQGDAGSGEVLAELTASKSTGYHRYTFDAGSTARTIVIDMGHTLDGKACKNSSMTAEPLTEPGVSPARWAVDAVMHSEGSYSGRFGGFQLFVAAQIEEVGDEDGSGGKGAGGGGRDGATAAPPISTKARVAMWDSVSPGTINWDAKALAGTMVGTALQFGPGARPIEMRLAVSFISAAQARANLAADLAAAPDFDAARAAAEAEWRAVLARVTVADGDQASRASLQVLYTALYHAHMAPTTLSEAGGTYLGLDKRPHQLGPGQARYLTDMSIWDIHRTQAPLLTLLSPAVQTDVVRSLVQMYRDGGDLPKWPFLVGYTGGMIGTHANAIIADAMSKGLGRDGGQRSDDADADSSTGGGSSSSTGGSSSRHRVAVAAVRRRDRTSSAAVDYATAYKAMRLQATEPRHIGRHDPLTYIRLGYLPLESDDKAASMTLAYAFDDAMVSAVAGMLGIRDDEALFLNRSRNYRNVWDPRERFFCPRTTAGEFKCPLDKIDPFSKFYTEGDAWHYRFAVRQDPAGLIRLFGGAAGFVAALEEFFETGARLCTSDVLPCPWWWPGNEEDLAAPSLFAYAGRRDLASKWFASTLARSYSPLPDGIPGNDDYGTMSAWVVWASLGLYPELPGGYILTGPGAFRNVSITLGDDDDDDGVGGAGGSSGFSALGARSSTQVVVTILGGGPDAIGKNTTVTWNGAPVETTSIPHSTLVAGGVLEYHLVE